MLNRYEHDLNKKLRAKLRDKTNDNTNDYRAPHRSRPLPFLDCQKSESLARPLIIISNLKMIIHHNYIFVNTLKPLYLSGY